MPNESNGEDFSGSDNDTEDAKIESYFDVAGDDSGMTLRFCVHSCQSKLRKLPEQQHAEGGDKETDEPISFKSLSSNHLVRIRNLDTKMAKVMASQKSGRRPKHHLIQRVGNSGGRIRHVTLTGKTCLRF